MTIIYVLTSGEYSDYSIEGVYSSKEKAEIQKVLFDWKWVNGLSDSSRIEEWELDKPLSPQKAIAVGMTKEGNAYYVDRLVVDLADGKPQYELFSSEGVGVLLTNTVITEDRKKAVKVTNELRTRLIARDLWHVGTKVVFNDRELHSEE